VTDNERLLLLLVADSMLAVFALPTHVRRQMEDARHALDAEAHAEARQSALQAGQGVPRSFGSGRALDAASDAYSPGTGIAPLPTSPDGVSELEWWNDNGVLRPGTGGGR
jgi:hypothetical protein